MAMGIRFNEVIAGSFALGETGLEACHTKGEMGGNRRTINAEVSITDREHTKED